VVLLRITDFSRKKGYALEQGRFPIPFKEPTVIPHPPRNVLCGAIVLALSCSALLMAQEKPVPVSYDLQVNIAPAQGKISVRGQIDVPRRDSHVREMQFALHQTFAVRELSVNGHKAEFSFKPGEFSPITPATRDVIVRLPSDVAANKVHLDIEYGGQLKQLPEWGAAPDQQVSMDDQINSRLVELANYSVWYPRFYEFSYPIQIEMEVSLPQGWIAICSGKKLSEVDEGGRTVTRWSSPNDIDILIAAGPNYKEKSRRLPNGQVEIYYTQLSEQFIASEVRQIADVMALFTDRLGETSIPAGTVKHVYSPKRKGQGRAGIARPGMIVTSEGLVLAELRADPKFSLFQDIAHEIGHFWWNFAAGQGDWINEAFAEYFSAVAVQKISSEQQFASVLDGYRKNVRELPADAPSIAEAPFDGSSFVIRYYKGSLMLDSLRGILGDEKFFQASREFFQQYKGKSIGTAEFRSFWKEKLGSQQAAVDTWLDARGGLPDLSRRSQSRGQAVKTLK
jgi:Peptidase family M1 domain